jgi:hypothetical protein
MTMITLSATLSATGRPAKQLRPCPTPRPRQLTYDSRDPAFLPLGSRAGRSRPPQSPPGQLHYRRPAMPPTRRYLTASRLSQLAGALTSREHTILMTLATVYAATTHQIARTAFADEPSAGRLARRHLQRLGQFGLVRRFVDRSRDRQVGAPGHIHALTAAGLRCVGGSQGSGIHQRTAWRPSTAFLAHRLAISELFVRLTEQSRTGGPAVKKFQAEPDCWRAYAGQAGERELLRPDALVRLVHGDAELSWFVEVDLGTETRPATIVDKCRRYRRYELSGQEQRRHGVFPGVIFIVPNVARARMIRRVTDRQPTEARDLFTVATEEQALIALIEVGGEP